MTANDPSDNGIESITNFADDDTSFLAEAPAKKEEQEPASYEIPRPMLTMQQAAAFLGKSVRALERSLLGRWGNKLPEGWSSKKIKTERGEEWRILPPPGFRVRTSVQTQTQDKNVMDLSELASMLNLDGLSESQAGTRRGLIRSEHSLEQPTIVIDRSEEVEHLLRELLATQKCLSEERRLHMEDLRIVAQMQGSMRLLETNAAENARAKTELESVRKELDGLKQEYNLVLNLPWWKRLFGFRRP